VLRLDLDTDTDLAHASEARGRHVLGTEGWRAATGSHAVPVPLPVTRALREGGLTNPGAWQGRVTFDAWLAS